MVMMGYKKNIVCGWKDIKASKQAFLFAIKTNSQYNISMLNIGQAARKPKGPSMLAAFTS